MIARVCLCACLIAGAGARVSPQEEGPAKEPQAAASPYAKEEASPVSPGLATKDAELRAALKSQPDSPALLYALALVLRQEGKFRESLDTYTQAARSRKPTAEELRSVAIDYVLLNDYDDAIHWLEAASRMAPADTDVLYALGRCYYSRGSYAEAETMFDRVLILDPKHLKAEENLGLAYEAMNRPDLAEAALRKAASWATGETKDRWPFLDLGAFLLDQDRAAEALDPLRTALRIDPQCAECHEKVGRALLETQDTAAAIAELEQAAQLDPQDPKTHYQLGRALRQSGQKERAQQEFDLSQKLYAAHSQE
jgi:tetratricopeptide (TPR) repeat protein